MDSKRYRNFHTATLSQEGSSIIEVLIVFSMITMAAFAILPLFIEVRTVSRAGQIQSLCHSVVRAKLEEYRFGRPVPLAEINASPGYLKRLSFPSASTSIEKNLFKSVTDSETQEEVAPDFKGGAGGFFYSKWRYNRFFAEGICDGTSDALILKSASSERKKLGVRECVGSNDLEDGSGICSKLDSDQKVDRELPGFKLYVKLERSNHWILQDEKWKRDAVLARRFHATCPVSNEGDFEEPGVGPLYDFSAAGDSIHVTVSGVIDFPSKLSGVEKFAGINSSDLTSLTCSASTTIAAAPFPFRFFRRSGEPILSWSGSSAKVEDNSHVPFQKAFGLPEPSENLDSIVAFSVHPLNLSLTVLKNGSLLRFSRCGGVPLDCSPDPSKKGISDSGGELESAFQSFTLQSVALASIGVDYAIQPSRIFGFSPGFSEVSRLVTNAEKPVIPLTESLDPKAVRVFRPWIEWVKSNTGRSYQAGRIAGVFMDPSGEEIYVADKTMTSGSTSVNFYRLGDDSMSVPVLKVPPGTVSFSK